MSPTRTSIAAILAAFCLVLSGCTPSTPLDPAMSEATHPSSQGNQSPSGAADASAGPLADANRPLGERATSTNAAGTVTRVAIDFGNTSDSGFSAPRRGTLVFPSTGGEPSPLIIVSHLRAPNCQDRSFAYPCPAGVGEFRYDEGMTYLGDHLAEQGYTVVIPDLGGIYIGADPHEPYSQTAMWEDVVSTFIDSLRTDSAGTTTIFGAEFSRPIDFTRIGLFAHSRSGQLIESAMTVAGAGHLKAVFAYGPAYDTVERDHISPALPDVPYLALVGDADADVGPSANLLLGHYATLARTRPASVAELPGLGHMYINRAASAASFDDRIGCDVLDCPDAAAHEDTIRAAAADWFNAILRGADTTLPTVASSPLPATVEGKPARWLALTPGAVSSVDAQAMTTPSGEPLSVCTFTEGMAPHSAQNPCPEPEAGVVQILTPVAYVASSASAAVNVRGARGISLHVSPSGTYEATRGTPVRITLDLAGGESHVMNVPADNPAVSSKLSDIDDGTYRLGTIRVALSDLPQDAVITGVTIAPEGHPIVLRSVDFWS